MKSNALLVSKSVPAAQVTHKTFHTRSSTTKQAAHRYERRKVREFLRHGVDDEEESLRLERGNTSFSAAFKDSFH